MAKQIGYLLDTNIWLERLLDQERAHEVGQLLDKVPSNQLMITDFSFHSIGVILHRLNRLDTFSKFVKDLFLDGNVRLLTILPEEMGKLNAVIKDYGLDFDDAYQYIVAQLYDEKLVSYDNDFDSIGDGRITPTEALKLSSSSLNR